MSILWYFLCLDTESKKTSEKPKKVLSQTNPLLNSPSIPLLFEVNEIKYGRYCCLEYFYSWFVLTELCLYILGTLKNKNEYCLMLLGNKAINITKKDNPHMTVRRNI